MEDDYKDVIGRVESGTETEVERRRRPKPSVSADNHQGQEDKSFHKQAGYMRAMISSHIMIKMSCKRRGFIYAGGTPPGMEVVEPCRDAY